jgi:ribosomal protein L17
MSHSTTVALDQWQILFHETMAALLRAQEAVSRQIGLVGLLKGLWTLSRDLKALNANLKVISEAPDGFLTDEFIQSHLPQIRELLRSIENLIDTAKRKGLMNRSLTSGPLGMIRFHGEYIADYLEALEMSVDADVLKAIDEGRSQIERGDYEVVDRLF